VRPRFPRREVSERIGLGKNSLRDRLQRRRPKRGGLRQEGRPWPVNTRLVAVRAGATTRARCGGCHCHVRLWPSVPVRPASLAEAGPASGARERTLGLRNTGIRRSCGRARGLWWLQKSTSGAWSRPRGHGSSSLAPLRGSTGGERAPEAGSRWRKPRAREQRYRWRAPGDPMRGTRKRDVRQGEGALGDGRRPGPAKGRGL